MAKLGKGLSTFSGARQLATLVREQRRRIQALRVMRGPVPQLCGWEVVVEWDDIFGARIGPRFFF